VHVPWLEAPMDPRPLPPRLGTWRLTKASGLWARYEFGISPEQGLALVHDE
jgi:hypothetical protein